MCDLYLGADNSRSSTPPSPFWTNPAIQSSTYTFNAGTSYPLVVKLQNADPSVAASGSCSSAQVDLYWSDPTTSFLILTANQILPTGSGVQPIGPHTTIGGDGAALFNFNWTPPASAATTNTGHVCLAALASCNSSDCLTPPATFPNFPANTASPLVAIHNVQVNPAPPGPPPPPPHRRIWPFFFMAANGGTAAGRTRIVARVYNPHEEAHRLPIWHLAGLPQVRAALGHHAKFAVPAEIHLAIGAESVLIPANLPRGAAVPRLSYTGAVAPDLADHLVKRDWVKGPGTSVVVKEVDLLPGQVQQAAVYVVPHGEEGHVYAVEICHEILTKDGPVAMGGLTVLFVAPARPW